MGLMGDLRFFIQSGDLPELLRSLSILGTINRESVSQSKKPLHEVTLVSKDNYEWKESEFFPLSLALSHNIEVDEERTTLDLEFYIRESAGICEISLNSFVRDCTDILRKSDEVHKTILDLSQGHKAHWLLYTDEATWPDMFYIITMKGTYLFSAHSDEKLDYLPPHKLYQYLHERLDLNGKLLR